MFVWMMVKFQNLTSQVTYKLHDVEALTLRQVLICFGGGQNFIY